MRCVPAIVLVFLPVAWAAADDGDDTLRFYLSKSEVVLLGEITTEPDAWTREVGVVSYGADLKIAQVIKGAGLDECRPGQTIKVNIVRFESAPDDRMPELRKGGKVILFLKCDERHAPPTYVTVDVWFGILRASPWLAKSLARLAADEAARPARTLPSVEERPASGKTVVRLQSAQPWPMFRNGRPLVFEGTAAVPIHRPGPEHFKIVRLSDGKAISARVGYEREQIEKRRPNQERVASPQKDVLVYNSVFKGMRLVLYKGSFDAKDPVGQEGILNLYGCPDLEPGVRYCLTWACRPVGASKAVEASCEFELRR